jgi:hypothetical protein
MLKGLNTTGVLGAWWYIRGDEIPLGMLSLQPSVLRFVGMAPIRTNARRTSQNSAVAV